MMAFPRSASYPPQFVQTLYVVKLSVLLHSYLHMYMCNPPEPCLHVTVTSRTSVYVAPLQSLHLVAVGYL